MDEVLKVAAQLLKNYHLCDNCLGRHFANLAYGTTNAERGRALKNTLVLAAHDIFLDGTKEGADLLKKIALNGMSEVARNTALRLGISIGSDKAACDLCEGKLQELENMAEESLGRIKDYEFRSFLVGAKIPESIIETEDSMRARLGVKWGETIKSEFTREIGKYIAKKTSRQVDYKNPDVTITFSLPNGKTAFQVNPIFIEGRYRKLITGIPQSRWLCRKCRGRGCKACGGTGKRYQESVQEIIEQPILAQSLGESTEFHAGGREDVDVKVLGRGRPFVSEVKNPKKRLFSLTRVRKTINSSGKVKVDNLKLAERETIRRVKAYEGAEKIYLAKIDSDVKIASEELANLEKKFKDAVVQQLGPRRTVRRRADKAKIKHIYELKVKKISSKRFQIVIRTQGGLYVREFVEGNGKVTPSIRDVLQKKVKCTELSVLDIVRSGG